MKETKRMSAAQRRARQRKLRNRRIAMTVALVLVVALASIGGTIAWLTDKTDPVVNTFTTADVDIDLTETWNADSDDDNDDANDHWEAQLVPGNTYAKDPKVTVNAGSEACYLFVHVAEANNTITGLDGKIVQYTMANGWKEVTGHAGFYYREVAADAISESGVSFYVLAGGENSANPNGQVKINENLTKEQEAVIKNSTPTITITAAAVQKDNVSTVADAWSKLPTEFTGISGT